MATYRGARPELVVALDAKPAGLQQMYRQQCKGDFSKVVAEPDGTIVVYSTRDAAEKAWERQDRRTAAARRSGIQTRAQGAPATRPRRPDPVAAAPARTRPSRPQQPRKPAPAAPAAKAPSTGGDWMRLARAIGARRTELGLSQRAVQANGGPSGFTITQLEKGHRTNYTDDTLRSLERALGWERGSIGRILVGGDPIEMVAEGVPDVYEPPPADDDAPIPRGEGEWVPNPHVVAQVVPSFQPPVAREDDDADFEPTAEEIAAALRLIRQHRRQRKTPEPAPIPAPEPAPEPAPPREVKPEPEIQGSPEPEPEPVRASEPPVPEPDDDEPAPAVEPVEPESSPAAEPTIEVGPIAQAVADAELDEAEKTEGAHTAKPPKAEQPTMEERLREFGERYSGAQRSVEPVHCGRCGEFGHSVVDCPVHTARHGGTGQPVKPRPDTSKSPKRTVPLEKLAEELGVDVPRRLPTEPRRGLTVVRNPERAKPEENPLEWLPGASDDNKEFDWDSVDLEQSASKFLERYRDGMPPQMGFSFRPDVLGLYGIDTKMMEDAVRHPHRVEIRPETFNKDKKYVILGFWRGDVQVIMGFRQPLTPAVIACYVSAKLDRDPHHLAGGQERTGGGGRKGTGGIPKTPSLLVKRLRQMGADVPYDGEIEQRKLTKVTVKYHGQEIGDVSWGPNIPRQTVETDWQRCQRRINAIDMRENGQMHTG